MNSSTLTEAVVQETLRGVIDPELDCNLVDLGLIYGIRVEEGKVSVRMTLTTAGCPMHESLAGGVKQALLGLAGVREAEVTVVWDPPWDPSRLSEAGRARLGVR